MMMLMILLVCVCVCVCVCDEGTIPWEVLHDFVQNHALRKIKLGNNNFDGVSGIPSLISAMTKLEELSLHSLGFTGMYTVITTHQSNNIICCCSHECRLGAGFQRLCQLATA